jgi:hypothetical protein
MALGFEKIVSMLKDFNTEVYNTLCSRKCPENQ